MDVTARPATTADLPEVERLYRLLEVEMAALEDAWPLADGLPGPLPAALGDALADPDTTVLVGCIDRVPFGFLIGRREDMLPQAGGERIGSVRFVFTEMPAREVGVAEAMLTAFLDSEREAGTRRFDAHVTPGHRLTKNFFEAGGFSARSIVMHRRDPGPPS
jgi:hypothetical protein